jgi:nucleotide-binding universal stress UspA family protein
MYDSILVPLDGSAFGEHALPMALNLARQFGAALQVVRDFTQRGGYGPFVAQTAHER